MMIRNYFVFEIHYLLCIFGDVSCEQKKYRLDILIIDKVYFIYGYSGYVIAGTYDELCLSLVLSFCLHKQWWGKLKEWDEHIGFPVLYR